MVTIIFRHVSCNITCYCKASIRLKRIYVLHIAYMYSKGAPANVSQIVVNANLGKKCFKAMATFQGKSLFASRPQSTNEQICLNDLIYIHRIYICICKSICKSRTTIYELLVHQCETFYLETKWSYSLSNLCYFVL